MPRKPTPDPTPDLFADLGDAAPEAGAPMPPPAITHADGAITLEAFAERAYLAYAMSVVKGRALPSIEDGQKPVQRRILFAMRETGSRADQPFRKSARIVGDVIGKFHPHGDSAVYEAAVRMAQDFTLRYPLIQGQGNFGSRDGDSAAAMRYTEIRLSAFAEAILLAELDRGTVDFRDNYDGSMREPVLLPARLPILLLNGASGIAVGLATEIPPHNLREIAAAAIEAVMHPDSSDEALLLHVPAPDFPGGGQIISSADDIRRAYLTGRGSIRVRARWSIEPLARGQYRIAIHELPPNTSTARVLGEIDELTNPKVKSGKRALSLEQQNMKAAVLGLVDTVRDDSDKNHPVRIVLEPRTSKVNADELMSLLLANTTLEGNVSVNMVMIGRDGRPLQAGLAPILRSWAEFRKDTVTRRLNHRLEEVNQRLHVLDGRLIAFLNIGRVIAIIRESDQPKADLITAFDLTETQAEDILDIRLRQLARLEGIKIEREIKELRGEQRSLETLLGNAAARNELVVGEIRADAERFGDARRSLVLVADKVTASTVEAVLDEPVTVVLSRNGFIRLRSGHGIDKGSLTWKEGDGELAVVETRTTHPIVLIASNGRTFALRSQELPGGKGDGSPVSSLIDLAGARLTGVLSHAQDARVLLASTGGCGFFGSLAEMVTRQRAGKSFATVEGDETLLRPWLWNDAWTELAALSGEGRVLIFPASELKSLPNGGRGVIVMGLRQDEALIDLQPVIDGQALTVRYIGRGDKTMSEAIAVRAFEKYRGGRSRMGRALEIKAKKVLGFA